MIILKMFFLLGVPLLLFLASVWVNFYIVFRDLSRVLENFKRSSVISSYAGVWGEGSIYSRYTLVCIVIGSVIFPNKHIRNGTLDSEELARFPGAIKLRMRVSFGLLVSAVLCFFSTASVLVYLKRL